jgi:hypothetical protein
MGSKNSSGAHKSSALIRRRFGTQEFPGDSPVALRFLAPHHEKHQLHQPARVRLREIVGARSRGSMLLRWSPALSGSLGYETCVQPLTSG